MLIKLLCSLNNVFFDKFRKYYEALADFAKAIELNPEAEYFYKRSNCYFQLGDLLNAKADAVTALQKGFMIPDSYKTALRL